MYMIISMNPMSARYKGLNVVKNTLMQIMMTFLKCSRISQ